MKTALVCLFLLIAAEVYYAPFTKVEESFNLQATHDILNQVDLYDHVEFPGVVPRTFFGAFLLSCLSWPFIHFFGLTGLDQQIVVRVILGGMVVLSLGKFASGVKSVFGSTTANLTIILLLCQFHLVFWSSRTLPNTLALPWVELGLSHWLFSLSQTTGRTYHLAWMIRYLTFAGVVFRFEAGILLVILLVIEYICHTISLLSIVKNLVLTAILSLLITVPLDSYLWGKWLWPEGMVFYFNAILNKSSEWGTLPFQAYFISFLPRLLLISYPLAWIAYFSDQRVRRMLTPMILYVLVFSFLPHKEWRFIMYTIPVFTAAAATSISSVIRSCSRSIVSRFILIGIIGTSIASFAVSLVIFQVSRLNYPGGEALRLLHKLEKDRGNVYVHLDVDTAMTGASLFGQLNSNWKYSKNENHTSVDDILEARYTHLITAKSPQQTEEDKFETIYVVEGLDKVQLKSVKAYKEGVLKRKDFSPIEFRMSPKLYILRSIHPQKSWIQYTLHKYPVVLYSKTYW